MSTLERLWPVGDMEQRESCRPAGEGDAAAFPAGSGMRAQSSASGCWLAGAARKNQLPAFQIGFLPPHHHRISCDCEFEDVIMKCLGDFLVWVSLASYLQSGWLSIN